MPRFLPVESRRQNKTYKDSALVYQTGALFLCLKIVTTRVMTAQSIITNVNKSEYVTILPAPFNVSGNWYSASSAPWVSILLSMYGFSDLYGPAGYIADKAGVSVNIIYRIRKGYMVKMERFGRSARYWDCFPEEAIDYERMKKISEQKAALLEGGENNMDTARSGTTEETGVIIGIEGIIARISNPNNWTDAFFEEVDKCYS